MAHLNYCDGASFTGHRDAPIPVGASSIYFRGRDILDASLSALLADDGLAGASFVMLKGCSAGGLAVILNVDRVAEVLRARVPSVVVIGVPDAGYFLDHNDTANAPSYTPLYQWVAAAQNVTPSVDAGCVASYAPAEQWRCFFAQYTAPFLTTPTFFAQDLDDSWQLSNIFRLGCSPYHGPGDCSPKQLADLTAYRLDTLSAMLPVISSPLHGAFLTSCVQHCHSNIDFCFNSEIVQGQNMAVTLWAFVQATLGLPVPDGVQTKVVDGPGLRNPTCTASCSPY